MRNAEDIQAATAILNPESEVDENQGELDLDSAIKEELELDEETTEETAEDETEETDSEADEETEAAQPEEGYTISSLAEAIEIEPSELYDVMVPLSDHGDPISIGKLKDGYEVLSKENPKLVEQVAELQKTAEETKNGTTPQQQLSQAEFQAQVAIAQVNSEYSKIDWADLEEYDPANAVLQKQKLQDRFNQANNMLQQAGQQRQADHQTFITQQLAERDRLIPEWGDSDIRTKDEAKIRQIMLDAGYNDEQIKGNADPISYMLLRELMQFREEKAAGIATVKKVKTAPKILRNTAKNVRSKQTKQAQLYSKAQKSGSSEQDKIAAVNALLNG